MKVELSKDECVNVADFIEIHLLDVIRRDTDIDNLKWVESILSAKAKFEKAVDEVAHELTVTGDLNEKMEDDLK